MFYLYSREGNLIGQYESTKICHELTGYSKSKLDDCLNTPGLVLGSCFISIYKWRNDKISHMKYKETIIKELTEEQYLKILKIMSKE